MIKCESESRTITIKDDPFLASLLDYGLAYYGVDPNKQIEVVAVEGSIGDYAVYAWSPYMLFNNVAAYGIKLPEPCAKRLFPEWAEKFKYRR